MHLARVTWLLFLAACTPTGGGADASADASTCEPACGLFGRPNQHTGLTSEQCAPFCVSDAGTFVSPDYDAAFVKSLVTDWVLAQPYAPLAADPYADAAAPPGDPPGTLCAVLPGPPATPRTYTLVTYPSDAAARAAGAEPTHYGRCGLCSPLADLAVYIGTPNLTSPVRACGIQALSDGGDPADVACLEALGFDEPCADIWAYNTDHTRASCFDTCIAALTAPYNEPDGALNPCLACDESQSGPVFKAVAGRTRRNSGLADAICRPCSDVKPIVHSY